HRDETGAGAALLDVIAVLSPAGTPRWILHAAARHLGPLVRAGCQDRWLPVMPHGVDAALGQLCDTSLLTFGEGSPVVRACRVTARVVRERQAADGTAALVGETAVGLLSELVAAVRLQEQAVELLSRLGDDPAWVIRLGEPLAGDCDQVLGADHPGTLAVRRHLARAYRMAGRTDEAIGLFERILTDCRRLYGSD